jgi:hypothetical protein
MRTRPLLLDVFRLSYWLSRRLFELVFLLARSEQRKEAEILLLRHELQALRRHVARPQPRPADRVVASPRNRTIGGNSGLNRRLECRVACCGPKRYRVNSFTRSRVWHGQLGGRRSCRAATYYE